jgi:hypothetical protein
VSCKTPVSWLLLEQHALGELAGEDSARVASHLAECEGCRACLARIEVDAKRELPALPARPVRPVRRTANVVRSPIAPIAAALALAAGLVLWMRARPGEDLDGSRVKGEGVTLALVTNDDAVLEAGVYRDGQIVKALVTCPPSLASASWDLVVFDDQGSSFPLAPARLACGNAVPLPGAFRLTGRAPQEICVLWSESSAIDRGTVSRHARDHRTCVKLDPAP